MKIKSKLNQRQKELQIELNAINDKLIDELHSKHYPKIKKKYEGKCFKTKNSYGGDCKTWWLYTKITKIEPDDLYSIHNGEVLSNYEGISFEITSDKEISIKIKKLGFIQSVGNEISEKEFNNEWNKMMKILNLIQL